MICQEVCKCLSFDCLLTTYDVNDSMFPLTFEVMSSENYEEWFWLLQNLKKVVRDKEVLIISNRHPVFICSILEVFGLENHVYCYHHLKANFSSFFSKHNTKRNKGKENALQFLDSISYAKLDHDYNDCLRVLLTKQSHHNNVMLVSKMH